jgi:hypothetical protein
LTENPGAWSHGIVPNGNGDDVGRRLTRLEDFVEVMAEEHKRLLTAQVVLTDRMDKLAEAQVRTNEQLRHTDKRMGVLIGMMDDWIRRQSE